MASVFLWDQNEMRNFCTGLHKHLSYTGWF